MTITVQPEIYEIVSTHMPDGIYRIIDVEVRIMHSPSEGFDNEKLGELEKELKALLKKRLRDAQKNRKAETEGVAQ